MLYTTPQIAGDCIACHEFTLTESFHCTMHSGSTLSLPVLPTFHFSCCAAPATFSAAFQPIGLTSPLLLHMQYPWPYPQWPSPCAAPTMPTRQHPATTMAPFIHQPHLCLLSLSSSTTTSRHSYLSFSPLHHNRQLLRGHFTMPPHHPPAPTFRDPRTRLPSTISVAGI